MPSGSISADEDLDEPETASIGDLKCIGSNAQVMVKVAVISAWAGLQCASKEQLYLVDVVRPHIDALAPLWLASLREYARLRFAPDNSLSSSASLLSNDVNITSADMDRAISLQVSGVVFSRSDLAEQNLYVISFTKTRGSSLCKPSVVLSKKI